jgi:sugar phosphate permease
VADGERSSVVDAVAPAGEQSAIAQAASPPGYVASSHNGLVWVLWATYGAFYFCRANVSAAVPFLKGSAAEGGLAIPADRVGLILGSLKITYAIGQLVNGQLAERFSPRKMLAVGMFASAALNLAFGMSTAFYFLLFVWACNGYVQALGWTPCMRVAANWIPPRKRGRAIGLIGTGYQIATTLTWLLAGWAVSQLGWRGAFFVPPVVLASAGLFMLLFLRESPHDHERHGDLKRHDPNRHSFAHNILLTVKNPAVWLLGLTLGLLNATRYGYSDWGIAHLVDVRAVAGDVNLDKNVVKSAANFIWLPLGGVIGAYWCGRMTDHWFGGRRIPMIFGLLVLLGLLSLVYDPVARASYWGTMGLLSVIGFAIFGAQVLLVGTAPSDLAHKGTAAAAVGFVNFMGYIGAFCGDWVTGHVIDGNKNWNLAVGFWAGCAMAGAVVVAFLWNATAREDEKLEEVQTP